MTRTKMRSLLRAEVAQWASRTYRELRQLSYPVTEAHGVPGAEHFYETEVVLLEANPEYVHLSVAVDDGGVRPSCLSRQASWCTRMGASTRQTSGDGSILGRVDAAGDVVSLEVEDPETGQPLSRSP